MASKEGIDRSFLEDILDSSQVGTFILDAGFRIVWVNKALETYFGLNRESILGLDKRKLIEERIAGIFEDPEDFSAKVLATYDDNTYAENFECHVLAGGRRKERWLQHWSQPIVSGILAGGRIEHYSDITERKQAERAAQKQQRILQSIIDKANTHLVYLDTDFNFVAVNASYARTCNRTPEALIGKNHFFFYPHEENEAIFKRVRDTGEAASFHDKPFEFPDQPERGVTYWDWTLTPVKNDDGTMAGLVFSLVETTERKKAEAAIHQLKKTESLGRMAEAIAHRYNNLLFAISGNLEMAMEDLPPESNLFGRLQNALTATKSASEISSLMLSYLGQSVARFEVIDLTAAGRRMVRLFKADMPTHITLRTDFPGDEVPVMGNEGQILQVLENLVANARESLGEAPGVVSVRLRKVAPGEIPAVNRRPIQFAIQDTDYACLEVRDSGPGIAVDNIEKLFDPFFSTKFPGRGLGLPVVLGTVRAHKGCITVATEPAGGCLFRVFFPLTEKRLSARKRAKKAAAAVFPGAGTVLLIEDEPAVRDIGAMMLRHLGWKVLEAKDGIEGVAAFQQRKNEIDCVLCDLSMPRMSGWETIRALRRIEPAVPVILSSGHDRSLVMDPDHPELPQAFLHKPYNLSDLKEALSLAMEKPDSD